MPTRTRKQSHQSKMYSLKKTQANTRRTRKEDTRIERIIKKEETRIKEKLNAEKKEAQQHTRNIALHLALMTNPKNMAMSLRGVSKEFTRNATVLAAKHGNLLIQYAAHGNLANVQRMVNAPEFKLQKNSPRAYINLVRDVCSLAFMEACRESDKEGHSEVARYLMRLASEPVPRVDPTIENHFALRYVCITGDVELFRMLMSWRGPAGERMNPAADDNECIKLACYEKEPAIVAGLLADERVDPTVNDQEPLRTAIMYSMIHNTSAIVELLLDWKPVDPANKDFVDPRIHDNILIRMVAYKGRSNLVELLLRWRHTVNGEVLFVDPRVNDNEALREADKKEHEHIIRRLLAWEGPNGERVDPTVIGR